METMIELTEAELDAVTGGEGLAIFTFSGTASGTPAIISGTLAMRTTATSASQSATFFLSAS